eukprot:g2232.t1
MAPMTRLAQLALLAAITTDMAVATAGHRGNQRKLQEDTEFPVSAGEDYVVEFDGDGETEEIVMAESASVPEETTVVVEDGDITTIVIGDATYSVSYDEDGEVDEVVQVSGDARTRRTQQAGSADRRLQSCEETCAGGANQLCGALKFGCRTGTLAPLLGAMCDDVDALCDLSGILAGCERTCAPSCDTDADCTAPEICCPSLSICEVPDITGACRDPTPPPTPAPGTPAPTTPAPNTPAPTTPAPVTPAPTTPAPVTPAPTTPAPMTPAPTTPAPVTPAPTTPAPVTPAPTTPAPTDAGSGCASRDGGPDYTGREACCNSGVNSLGRICSDTVGAPCVFVDETPAPTTPAPTTPAPATPAPTTPAPATPAPTTPAPATPAPTTPAPATPAPTTPAPATPAPTTPAPGTPAPLTPAPSTGSPVTPAPTDAGSFCDLGIPGIQAGDVCCLRSCGECRGAGCSSRDGGPDYTGEEACCNAGVNSLGRICSDTVGAPCVFVDETPAPTTPAPTTPAPATPAPATPSPTTPAPATPAPVTPAPTTPAPATPAPTTPAPATPAPTPGPTIAPVMEATCMDGVPGLLYKEEICCPTSCGTCAGNGCSDRDGGDFSGHEACCRSGVEDLGRVCSATVGAPCIVSDEPMDDSTCSNGLPGYETSDVCCPLSCGQCGGVGCSGRGEGCCTSEVKESGDLCSVTMAAPCNIDGDDVVDDDSTCSNGLPGYETSDVCCPLSCGECGGVGCSGRGEGCCTSDVKESGDLCSVTMAAPCNIDGDDVVDDDSTCSNGLPGYETSDVCCPLSCGECGGVGCSGRGEGCCTSDVKESGDLCSVTMAAPCNIDGDDVVDDEEMCMAGVPGILAKEACCPTSCGSCGGDGCSGRDGGDSYSGSQACCISGVKALGRDCSADVGAPCRVD